MLLGVSLEDSFGYCLVCKSRFDCDCSDYIGDAHVLVTALSCNGFVLKDLYRYVLSTNDYAENYYGDLSIGGFLNPYIDAVHFIIKAGRDNRNCKEIKVRKRGNSEKEHWDILPILLVYQREMKAQLVSSTNNLNSDLREMKAQLVSKFLSFTSLK
ncbi:MAG: hypothetical protein HAW67_03240 [Endozoicomonadaceae bacterium]|nr:hypothetical protein [Endozoicomonadaceae bacterium]